MRYVVVHAVKKCYTFLIPLNQKHAYSYVLKRLLTMSNSEVKKLRLDSEGRKVIGTHNGTFHCDEVLACFMLRTLEAYRDARYGV